MSEPISEGPQIMNEKQTKKREEGSSSKTFIDSVFLSSGILVVMAIIVILSVFVMGYYVFSLQDREIKMAIAQEWIDSSQTIIISAQEHQQQLNDLLDTIPRIEASKRNLLLEEANASSALFRVQTQLNEKNATQNELDATIAAKRSQIATSEDRLIA